VCRYLWALKFSCLHRNWKQLNNPLKNSQISISWKSVQGFSSLFIHPSFVYTYTDTYCRIDGMYSADNLQGFRTSKRYTNIPYQIITCILCTALSKHDRYMPKQNMINDRGSQHLWQKNAIFWDVMPCGTSKNWHFGGRYHLHHQGGEISKLGTCCVLQLLVTTNVVPSSLILSTLMMEVISSSKTSPHTRATCLQIP
jgi:hypothetical protein